MESAVLAGRQKSAGFLLYSELAPLAPNDLSSSPDAPGDAYQQALLVADQVFGEFLSWLTQQGLRQNTLIALTTNQTQANHTDADNFYGMGTTGQGSSKQTLLALSGSPGCRPMTLNTQLSTFIIAPVLLHTLGLSAPAEAYYPTMGGC
jgi:membrane-anchored protein YejM (alkaline phosphatase superfamily)